MENPNILLTKLYTELTGECIIRQLGPPFAYYYADDIKTNICATNLIEIDIKSAFPTICKILYGEDHPFVQKIFSIEDKLERNRYISITMTEQTKLDGNYYLGELNIWSKMLVLSYVYSKYSNIHILEYVKDGALITGEPRDIITPQQIEFLKYVETNQIQFHENFIRHYLRFNRTSIYLKNDQIKIKGAYHNPPKFIFESIQQLLSGSIYDPSLLMLLKKIYSPLYFNILFRSSLKKEIDFYYGFDAKYLQQNGRLSSSLADLYPKAYLNEIIYPILSLLRLHYRKTTM